jgi:hypothetical protein
MVTIVSLPSRSRVFILSVTWPSLSRVNGPCVPSPTPVMPWPYRGLPVAVCGLIIILMSPRVYDFHKSPFPLPEDEDYP